MISAALGPLVAAGIDVRTVTTAPAALVSLGRLRRGSAVPHPLEAYVALEETATCIALIRDGALITAREVPWGFIDPARGPTHVRRRDEIAERLGHELSDVFSSAGEPNSAVNQICVCGGLPELRSMTAGLTERLDIEVEPLDSLFGIDAARLPNRADEFRERARSCASRGPRLRIGPPPSICFARSDVRRRTAPSPGRRSSPVSPRVLGSGGESSALRWRSAAPDRRRDRRRAGPPAPIAATGSRVQRRRRS